MKERQGGREKEGRKEVEWGREASAKHLPENHFQRTSKGHFQERSQTLQGCTMPSEQALSCQVSEHASRTPGSTLSKPPHAQTSMSWRGIGKRGGQDLLGRLSQSLREVSPRYRYPELEQPGSGMMPLPRAGMSQEQPHPKTISQPAPWGPTPNPSTQAPPPGFSTKPDGSSTNIGLPAVNIISF